MPIYPPKYSILKIISNICVFLYFNSLTRKHSEFSGLQACVIAKSAKKIYSRLRKRFTAKRLDCVLYFQFFISILCHVYLPPVCLPTPLRTSHNHSCIICPAQFGIFQILFPHEALQFLPSLFLHPAKVRIQTFALQFYNFEHQHYQR